MEERDYKVQIQQFEGPLDLLLHLINKARISIEDIFVSEVTGQYLEYISSTKQISMDSASEFLLMAALLVYIKSRMILPFDEEDYENEEEGDPEQQLIQSLKVYKLFKDACEILRGFEDQGARAYYKYPEEIDFAGERIEIEAVSLSNLAEAYANVLSRKPDGGSERIDEVEIAREIFTIRDRAKFILNKLSGLNCSTFFSLFSEGSSRMEVAVTFIALLELIHESIVTIKQEGYLEEIYITRLKEEAV
jgi:segregation and condensation protein A